MTRFAIGILAFALMISSASAFPSWWRGTLPECADPSVLAKVQKKIAYGAPRVLGYPLAIDAFDGISQEAVEEYGRSLIDRRLCRATASFSNGSHSQVVYLIEASQGFASVGWNVESCLPNYDRWRVHGAWCSSIRP